MKNFKTMLEGMTDRKISTLAARIWESYEADGEDGIAESLGVDAKEAAQMLDVPFDTWETPERLADAMRIYRDGGTQAAYLKAELRQLKEREAEIKAKLKELEGA